MTNETRFRQLWAKFTEKELLTNVDWLFLQAPTNVYKHLRCVNLQSGCTLIQQGAAADYVYIILDGEFIVNKSATNGKQVSVTLCYRGEFLGEVEALTHMPYLYDVIALHNSRVIQLPTSYFIQWIQQNHALSLLLNRQLAKRLLISGEQRLRYAVDSIENNLLYILQHIHQHKLNLSRDLLATILCTSRRHLDKVILRLKEQNRLYQEGNELILLTQALDQSSPFTLAGTVNQKSAN